MTPSAIPLITTPEPNPERQDLRSLTIVYLLFVIATLGYFLVLAAPFLNMFLLMEYRQWVFAIDWSEVGRYLTPWYLFDPSGTSLHFMLSSGRSVSYLFAAIMGNVCSSLTCHNLVHWLIILAATGCNGLTAYRLAVTHRDLAAAITFAVTLISIPVMDALTWQATILDKLAMLFSSLTLLYAASIDVRSTEPPAVLRINVILLGLFFLTMNAKEAGFSIGPSVGLLIALRLLNEGVGLPNAIGRALRLTVLPMAYAILQIGMVFYNRVIFNPGEYARVTSGNLTLNAEYFPRYVLNLLGPDYTYGAFQWLAALHIGIVLAASIAVIVTRRGGGWPLALWAGLSFALALAITLRTSAMAPFYLLAPMLYFGLAMGLSADALASLSQRKAWIAAVATAFIAGVIARFILLTPAMKDFNYLAKLSTHVQRSFAELRPIMANSRPKRLIFVKLPEVTRAWMFVSGPGDVGPHALTPFLLQSDTPLAELREYDTRILDVALGKEAAIRQPGDLLVYLDANLGIEKMDRVP